MSRLSFTILCVFEFITLFSLAQKPLEYYEYEIHNVKDGIYVAVRPEPLRFAVDGNVTIIVNEKDIFVVDASGTPIGARELIRKIRQISDKPISFLINTHFHTDHVVGNQEFKKAYPAIRIISTPETRADMMAITSKGVAAYFDDKTFKSRIKFIRDEIAKVNAERYRGYEKVVANLANYADHDIFIRRDAFREVTLTPPDSLFNGTLVLKSGSRELRILAIGKGDTPGDAWIFLPKEKVLISGDAVVYPIPYGFSGFPIEWLQTLKNASNIDFDILIPGHGEIQHGKTYIQKTISLHESIQKQIKSAVNAGKSEVELPNSVDISALEKEFTNGDAILRYYFNSYFKEPNFRQVYKFFKEQKDLKKN
ncbi:MAG TPA: MBL fold metallo-hydrolase [Cyclobacteriaceae bacterium]|nr:MBL fold metallo-hydrolase [Cyclobacteriaceae bacterium]